MSVIIDTFICTWLKMIISVYMWLLIYPARYFNKLLSGDYQWICTNKCIPSESGKRLIHTFVTFLKNSTLHTEIFLAKTFFKTNWYSVWPFGRVQQENNGSSSTGLASTQNNITSMQILCNSYHSIRKFSSLLYLSWLKYHQPYSLLFPIWKF